MKKIKLSKSYEVTPVNKFHAKLLKAFPNGGISECSSKTGISRKTIYKWIRDGEVKGDGPLNDYSHNSRTRLRAGGYNPDTLKHL